MQKIADWGWADYFNKINMKKNFINVPKKVRVIYSNKQKILIVSKFLIKKTLKLKVQLFIIKSKRILKVSSVFFWNVSNNKATSIKNLQNTTVALIKQIIIETEILFYKQLKFIGIGYWVFDINNLKKKLLLFKIGYSHFLYFSSAWDVSIVCLQTTKLFVFSNSYQKVTQVASLIRSFKKPEPYKSKGILYANENIILKIGKKI